MSRATVFLSIGAIIVLCLLSNFYGAFVVTEAGACGGMPSRPTAMLDEEVFSPNSTRVSASPAETPRILVWTVEASVARAGDKHFLTWLQNNMRKCPYKCIVDSREKIAAEEAHALLFHVRVLKDLPKTRLPEQVYVWACHEAPQKCGDKDMHLPPRFFNASMTNLRDGSGYDMGYGRVIIASDPTFALSDEVWQGIITKKRRLGLAVVSNCRTNSMREIYLQELALHANLTLLGECYEGSHVICSKQVRNCMEQLYEEHYFYFAFENTICKDYVTEKIFQRLSRGIVPVVLRRRILDGIVPPDAFIAADDFTSPKLLAEYLLRVAQDHQLYRRYFVWRDSHKLSYGNSMSTNGVCALCRDLWMKNNSLWSSNFNAREHYSYSKLCEDNVGCKLAGKC